MLTRRGWNVRSFSRNGREASPKIARPWKKCPAGKWRERRVAVEIGFGAEENGGAAGLRQTGVETVLDVAEVVAEP